MFLGYLPCQQVVKYVTVKLKHGVGEHASDVINQVHVEWRCQQLGQEEFVQLVSQVAIVLAILTEFIRYLRCEVTHPVCVMKWRAVLGQSGQEHLGQRSQRVVRQIISVRHGAHCPRVDKGFGFHTVVVG